MQLQQRSQEEHGGVLDQASVPNSDMCRVREPCPSSPDRQHHCFLGQTAACLVTTGTAGAYVELDEDALPEAGNWRPMDKCGDAVAGKHRVESAHAGAFTFGDDNVGVDVDVTCSACGQDGHAVTTVNASMFDWTESEGKVQRDETDGPF